MPTVSQSIIASIRLRGGDVRKCLIAEDLQLSLRQSCIVDIHPFLEWGFVQELAEPHGEVTEDGDMAPLGRVLRVATQADARQQAETVQLEAKAFACFREHVARLRLNMRPLQARYSFDRKRVLMLFGADQKVDFRRLIYHLRHDLPGMFVELRHLGVRDEAGLIGGFGPCGRQLCCATWLERFRAVNIRMAKVQGLPFNPQTVSGMCGRLKCCLRYEYDQYRECAASFPKEGTEVAWDDDSHGTVIARELLNNRLTVRTPDHRILHLNLADVSRYEPDTPESHDDSSEDEPPPDEDDHT